MAELGKYCKAFRLGDLRRFSAWEIDESALAPERQAADNDPLEALPSTLDDDVVFFLHENLTVTDGIYVDEHIVFSKTSEAWRRFCKEELDFEPPPSTRVMPGFF